MKLKSNVILSLNNIVCIAMWSLVHSKCFIIYYRLMVHGSTIKVCLILYHYINDYMWYYICSTWFLDIRISTCLKIAFLGYCWLSD